MMFTQVLRAGTRTLSTHSTPNKSLLQGLSKPGDPRMGTMFTGDHTGDVVILGFPYDEGAIRNAGRKGAEEGPASFRKFWPKLGTAVNQEYFINVSGVKIGDAGNVGEPEACGTLEIAHRQLKEKVTNLLKSEQSGVPFVVGGSRDVSYPVISAVMKHHKDVVSVVSVDAHLNVRPLMGEGQAHAGSVFRQLLDDPAFKGNFSVFGAQGASCSAAHASFVTGKGGRIIWLDEATGVYLASKVSRLATSTLTDMDVAAESFQRVIDSSPGIVHVSFDLDSMKGAEAPGVSTPSVIGFTSEQMLRFCYLAGCSPRVCSIDVAGLNPVVEGFITPRLVGFMLYYYIMGLASRKGSK